MELDIGEDRILLQVPPEKYKLDVFLPFFMIPGEAGAQLNKVTHVSEMCTKRFM